MLPAAQIGNLIDLYIDGPMNGGAGPLGVTRLFTNDVTPSALTVLGDLTEATFDGYAPAGPMGDDWYKSVDAETGFVGARHNTDAVFHATTGVGTPQVVYGWYYTSDGGALAFAIRLPQPITIVGIQDIAIHQFIPFSPSFTPR